MKEMAKVTPKRTASNRIEFFFRKRERLVRCILFSETVQSYGRQRSTRLPATSDNLTAKNLTLQSGVSYTKQLRRLAILSFGGAIIQIADDLALKKRPRGKLV